MYCPATSLFSSLDRLTLHTFSSSVNTSLRFYPLCCTGLTSNALHFKFVRLLHAGDRERTEIKI